MTTVLGTPLASGRDLVGGELFERLVSRVVTDAGVDREMAERAVDQSLAFLAASARHVGEPLSPSAGVDLGWHAFLLYTREYTEFCHRIAGRFIHHVPDDAPGSAPTGAGGRVGRTPAAIEAAGYVVDHELWFSGTDRCGSCHEEGNCNASGGDGNENSDNRGKD
ncbi:hypothetical protein UO65_4738 [Actinokineospora spheciospongiae]|uniref:Uncharacterized protein n=1 Tax=Actinokineospora spheciospongiae TaxID=909613 RepID=W7IHW7_9PSEU|nr:hypothetical protein [Actinokineospora spheciospongiae]EWC59958.1 hypothetical protein UO65_4738 [Actinokineospora spheciospongiae]